MKPRSALFTVLATAALVLAGCATEPTTENGRDNLDQSVQAAMAKLRDRDPSLKDFLGRSYAYAVFPTVATGGVVVGGSYGHGEVFMGSKMIGYADISQVTAGAQIGGAAFTEIIAFQDEAAFQRFKSNKLSVETTASAILLKSGAAESSTYKDGFIVFTYPREGAMAAAVVGGQSFSFQPIQ